MVNARIEEWDKIGTFVNTLDRILGFHRRCPKQSNLDGILTPRDRRRTFMGNKVFDPRWSLRFFGSHP